MRRIPALLAVAALALTGCAGGAPDPEPGRPDTTTSPPSGATTTLPTSTTGGAATSACGSIGFTPASEDAATDIEATGVTCEEARQLVDAAGRRTSSGGPQSVTVNGYRCVLTRSVEDPLPVAFYRCTGDRGTVTFARS